MNIHLLKYFTIQNRLYLLIVENKTSILRQILVYWLYVCGS